VPIYYQPPPQQQRRAQITPETVELSAAATISPQGVEEKTTQKVPFSGTLSALTGVLVTQFNQVFSLALSAMNTLAGAISKSLGRNLDPAASNVAGSIAKSVSNAFVATVSVIGTLGTNYVSVLAFTARSLFSANAVKLSTKKAFVAALALIASQGAVVQKVFNGAGTFSGNINKGIVRSLSGFVSGSSVIVKAIQGPAFTGAVSAAGSVTKHVQSLFAAVVASGAQFTKTITRSLPNASLSTIGNITRKLSRLLSVSILAASGAVSKSESLVAFTGALGTIGSLATLLLYTAYENFTAAITTTGRLARATSKTLTATNASTSALAKSVVAALSATESIVGSIAKSVQKALQATTGVVATLATELLLFVTLASGSLGVTGSIGKTTQKPISGSTAQAGRIYRSVQRVLIGGLALTGSITRQISRSLAASTIATGGYGAGVGKIFTAIANFLGALAHTITYPILPILHPYVLMATPITAMLSISTPILLDAEE